MTKKDLHKLRNQINDLDNKILSYLDERSNIVTKIGDLKDKSKSVVDVNRETEILKRIIALSKGKYSKDSIMRIWRELFEASSKLQVNVKSFINTKRSIENISIYEGGKSTLDSKKRTDDNEIIIKLSSNENPFGPSSSTTSINLKNNLNRYPEINGITLRQEIANLHNINKDQIILGCGSDETLLFAALSFCQYGDEIIQAEHGFEMYSIISKVLGATTKYAKEKDYKVSIDSVCNEITPATKLIYLANPNNPTGSYLSKNEVRDLMTRIPKNIIVVLDGAYAEYVMEEDYDSDFSLIGEFENIIITRTFSKAYGLAAIRLGWCYSSPRVSSILNKVKGPFNTSSLSQKIAINALKDKEHLNYVVAENKKNKLWFENELKKINIRYHQSFANFTLIELDEKNAQKMAKILLKNGVIVRQLNSYKLPNCLRITIGTMKDMKKTIDILATEKW